MKRTHAAIVCLTLAGLVLGSLNWHRICTVTNAQDSVEAAETDSRVKQRQADRNKSDSSDERDVPAFYVEDLVEILTTNAETLLEQKIARNSRELRKDLNRSSFPMSPIAASAKVLRPEELYRRVAESVFLVAGLTRPDDVDASWQTSFSTAFAVREDGILSTSAHVFDHDDHDDAVVVMDVQGKVWPVVEVLAADRKADTCLFRIGKKGVKPLPLGKNSLPGAPIRVMGHPGDSFFFFSAGHVANFERDDEGFLWMNVTADFGQGSSGGPVMDSAGNVVAQVSRTYTLYAGGEASRRGRQPRSARQPADSEQAEDPQPDAEIKDVEVKSVKKNRADPQMVFNACTPVSALRSLLK